MTIDLTTLALVKMRLHEISGTAEDGTLSAYITQMSHEAARFLGRRTGIVADAVDVYDAQFMQKHVFLTAWPVDLSVDFEIRLSADQDFDDDASLLTMGTHYILDDRRGIVTFRGVLSTCGPGALQVTSTAGMAANTTAFIAAYPDIAGAVADQVAWAWRRRNTLGLASKGIGGVSIAMATQEWLESARMALVNHARWVGVG